MDTFGSWSVSSLQPFTSILIPYAQPTLALAAWQLPSSHLPLTFSERASNPTTTVPTSNRTSSHTMHAPPSPAPSSSTSAKHSTSSSQSTEQKAGEVFFEASGQVSLVSSQRQQSSSTPTGTANAYIRNSLDSTKMQH